MQRHHWFTLLGLITAVSALLGLGSLQFRQNYLTRGIPTGLPEPVNYGLPTLGFNVYLEQYDDAELATNLAAIAASGGQWIKQPFYYSQNFDWTASDRLVTAVTNHHLRLVPLLDGDPANHFAPIPPDQFAAWATAFAARYSDQLQFYIIWDEPNLTSHWGHKPVNPIEYAALLTAAAAAIRAADSDAVIIAAPLAPTIETGPTNLADPLYLQRLYEAGAAPAFDIAAAKPYGFHTPPDDRRVNLAVLNFSRAILLREVMVRSGDAAKALWAGNWGWNSLPENWTGAPSIWGAVTAQQQADWTMAAAQRAAQEWPWMGVMFLENWEPNAPADDPRWGFQWRSREWGVGNGDYGFPIPAYPQPVALPGFHLARPNNAAQVYAGGWEFSPEFGADISQPAPGTPPDSLTFTFWGTDVGLRVRRADFRARLYVTVDGRAANALPRDENGAMLILTSADPAQDFLSLEAVATGLEPGVHTLQLVADRGWDQWALHGFSVAYHPPVGVARWVQVGLWAVVGLGLWLAGWAGRQADWPVLRPQFDRLTLAGQWGVTAVTAAIVALTGWLTWGAQAEGVYRRLGDVGQLALTAVTASIFYVAPSFVVYAIALIVLWALLTLRPAWGLALIAFSFPFYVLPKPMLGYRFSPVEIFTWLTLAAVITHWVLHHGGQTKPKSFNTAQWSFALRSSDYAVLTFVALATLSLFFTVRQDVAGNEWRVVVVEPALFYLMWRGIRPSRAELWAILDAFVLGGVVVAGYGLWQYAFDRPALITAEGGLMRLRSVFGSPNNVGLYLGRVLPLVTAVALFGSVERWRRWAYVAAILPLGGAILLSFSKGALLLGLPAALGVIFWQWQQGNGRRTWPWVLTCAGIGLLGLFLAQQIPTLAGRLNLTGATGFFRVNLWRASLNMFADHPLIGVGLDNFLYAYRGRYIFDAAWQEPNLNHPHNILLDFATRLGILGLLAGGWLFAQLGWALRRAWDIPTWRPVTVGVAAMLADMLAHGLVDHSFFLVDLAFVFYLMLGTAVLLPEEWPGDHSQT